MRPELQSYRHLASGKVREIYEIDADTLLLVASDRISAYDHILSPAIPDKGRILTAMSFYWFDELGVPNHLAGGPTDERIPASVVGRSMVVRRLPMVQVECVARGYLTGSGLLDYQATGSVCGVELPAGLAEASKLPEPIFTPATKAEQGEHDENISFERVVEQEGEELAQALRSATLDIYARGAAVAAERGIILADTKFEFGRGADGELVLADEVLTVVGRSMVVRRLPMVQVECVARGYLTGSGLLDYQATGSVCGVELPAGLAEASKLPEPIFTPATKAEQGEHDENISFERVVEQEGEELAQALRSATLDIYARGAAVAAERGIILADTKFEFGRGADGELVLADEVLTPDSSRYWEAATYEAGKVQPSFDKQIVRNWLTGAESGWDRASDVAPPPLPDDVVDRTRQRYIDAYEWISRKSFADWPDAEVI